MAVPAGGGGMNPWLGVAGIALFAGSLVAVATGFPVSYVVLALLALALFFIGIVTTLLNPMVRMLFFFAGLVALGALAATAAWVLL